MMPTLTKPKKAVICYQCDDRKATEHCHVAECKNQFCDDEDCSATCDMCPESFCSDCVQNCPCGCGASICEGCKTTPQAEGYGEYFDNPDQWFASGECVEREIGMN